VKTQVPPRRLPQPRRTVRVQVEVPMGVPLEVTMAAMTGVIVRKVEDRGFGFIRGDQSTVEYFFHRNGVILPERFEDLSVGTAVSFEKEAGTKGPRAGRVASALGWRGTP
jgi:cold shock CspA family protein